MSTSNRQERFDEIAQYTNEYGYEHKVPKYDEIKSFISILLSEQKQEIVEMTDGMMKLHEGMCTECKGDGFTVEYDPTDPSGETLMQVQCPACEATGIFEMPNIDYNQALTYIQTKLTHKEEKV